ncbi:hypothetical protein [Paenimyroides baculatum]|uniref:Uncharacterized protein n=1 Tax=Paenimyroides baculatum TaxID=2608000 RepID=A0A5M6CHD7_9FLAO|nr:hypothetical protein [Paenimyroides baculatum]KAA5532815.1 hypothetical protein F0460_13300 [Paenimyroides baculatum]
MRTFKNVVCIELDFDIEIEPEHWSNMNIISKNLTDFNERFKTDFIVNYSVDDYFFTPLEDESNELLIWFLEGVPELLSFAYSPTMSSYEDLDLYLNNRRKELKYVFSKEMFENFQKRYIDYAPLGFLEKPDAIYIKSKLTDMILDHSLKYKF